MAGFWLSKCSVHICKLLVYHGEHIVVVLFVVRTAGFWLILFLYQRAERKLDRLEGCQIERMEG